MVKLFKSILVFCIILINSNIANAQNYQIIFAGIGESTNLDSVMVQNVTQNTQLTIDGDDVLHLVGVLTNVIDPMVSQGSFHIYPNPMSESALLEFNISESTQTGIEIFDISGKLITSLKLDTEKAKHIFEIKGLSAGVYTIRMSTKNWQNAARLVSTGEKNSPSIIKVGTQEFSNVNNTKKAILDLVQMQYNNGDLLVFTGYSGVHSNISTLVPTNSQQVQKHIVSCIDPSENSYSTVTIGEQVWMAENLVYDNGCAQISASDNSDNGWCGIQSGSPEVNSDYGFYYQWSVATNICPTGWKLPSDEDWKTLEFTLGMSETEIDLFEYRGNSEGSKLAGKSFEWNEGDLVDDDNFYLSGFTALPGGHVMPSSSSNMFLNAMDEGLFWSSSHSGDLAIVRGINSQSTQISRTEVEKYYACNVRCLRDTIIDDLLPNVETTEASSISHTSAQMGGNILNEGAAFVTSRGVVYGMETNPTIENNIAVLLNGSGNGIFSNIVNNLDSGITYYFRAFGVNEFGTAYGEEISFQTIDFMPPSVATLSLNQINDTTVSITAYCLDNGGASVTSRGVVYSTEPNPTIDNSISVITQGSGLGQFICQISDLDQGNTYYVKSFATNSVGTSYGQELSFVSSLESQLPSVSTTSAESLYHFYAEIHGSVSNQGADAVIERGVVINTISNPTLDENQEQIVAGSGLGDFIVEIETLLPQTSYFVRAYATNSIGTAYGDEIAFNTPSSTDSLPCSALPLFADLRDSIIYNTVQIGTQCWMLENLKYLPFVYPASDFETDESRYYVYDYNSDSVEEAMASLNYQNFGVLYNKMAAYNGEYFDASNLNQLKGNCPYGWHLPTNEEWIQLRDYLIENEYNFDYTNEENKIAKSLAAQIEWNSSSNTGAIGNNFQLNNRSGFSALPGGQKNQYSSFYSINSLAIWWSCDGEPDNWGDAWYLDYNITDFRYSSSQNPKEAFSVRCIKDSLQVLSLPTVGTSFVTDVSYFSATSGGEILDDGNSEITSKGIVWSTSHMPTIESNDGLFENGFNNESFVSDLDGLNPQTIYYLRAYAINNLGVSYGTERSLQTLSLPPLATVETMEVSTIEMVSAYCGAIITNDFGYPISNYGIVWAITSNPTVETNIGIAYGDVEYDTFIKNIDSLEPSTNYYVRAFVSNIAGLAYGNEMSFTTKDNCVDTLFDVRDGVVYDVVQIGNQCWMQENLKYLPEVHRLNQVSIEESRYYVYDYDGILLSEAIESENYTTYGVLYNWEAARFACPSGWHLSTQNDWVELERYICLSENCDSVFPYDDFSGSFGEFEGSMLIKDTALWISDEITNNTFVGASGFNALPAGWKFSTSYFSSINTLAQFWLATEIDEDRAIARYLTNSNSTINRYFRDKDTGNSVRCVLDQ